MRHSTIVSTTHTIELDEEEGDVLGKWLLELFDIGDSNASASDIAQVVYQLGAEPLRSIVGELANHLNGAT